MNKFALLFVCLAAAAFNGCGSKEDVDTPAFNACSNNSDVLNLPFKYDIESETNRILLESSGDASQNVYVHFAPFGAHFEPMTSHAYGDNKVNFFGFFSESDDQVPDLAGGQSGFNGGLDAVNLHNLRPIYTSPGNGRITSINYVGRADETYLDNQYWMITLKYSTSLGSFGVTLDHIGELSPNLHLLLEEELGFDSYDYSPDPSNYGNILPNLGDNGISHITIPTFYPLGYPQVRASLVPGQSEDIWYNGTGSAFEDRPSIIIEYSVSAPTANGNNDVCLFELLSTTREEKFQAILEKDLTNEDSQFYRTFTDTAWQWRAESSVCLSCSTKTNALNGLYKDLGGWFESDSNVTAKDELISFIPIATDSPLGYDATLYNNNGGVTEWLILRRNLAELFTWQMQDMSIIEANYPAGEIITIEDDALLVEWRDLEAAGSGTSAFQWLCYDITDSVVTIKFGEFKDSMAPREVVLDLAVDTPDGVEVIAYVKDKISGF